MDKRESNDTQKVLVSKTVSKMSPQELRNEVVRLRSEIADQYMREQKVFMDGWHAAERARSMEGDPLEVLDEALEKLKEIQ